MNNRNGMFGMMSLGAVGAAVFGLARGMRNGTFRPLLNNMKTMFKGNKAQKAPGSGLMLTEMGMMHDQGLQKIAKPVQSNKVQSQDQYNKQ